MSLLQSSKSQCALAVRPAQPGTGGKHVGEVPDPQTAMQLAGVQTSLFLLRSAARQPVRERGHDWK